MLERMQGKGGSPDQHSRRLSEQGLPCLKSGRPEGPEGTASQFLPLQLATFSLEALGCLSESLTLLTCGVGGTIPDLKVDERMPMGMGGAGSKWHPTISGQAAKSGELAASSELGAAR